MENGLSGANRTYFAHMWISKPIYESLPYLYLLIGVISLAASMYIDHWYWPSISFIIGLCALVAGMVVLLKRRDARMKVKRGQKT